MLPQMGKSGPDNGLASMWDLELTGCNSARWGRSAMRRFADLEMPLAELTLCANNRHSSLAATGRGADDQSTSAFRANRDTQDVRNCERDQQSSRTSDDSVNGHFSPFDDVRERLRDVRVLVQRYFAGIALRPHYPDDLVI